MPCRQMQFAVPLPPVGSPRERRPQELDRRAQFAPEPRRLRNMERSTMAAAHRSDRQVDPLEAKRPVGHLVEPVQVDAAQHDPALGEQPGNRAAAVAAARTGQVEYDAGDPQPAIVEPFDPQRRRIDVEPGEAQLAGGQAAQRQDGIQSAGREGRRTLVAGDRQLAHLERRAQAIESGAHLADSHRPPDRLRQHLLGARQPVSGVRPDQVAQRQIPEPRDEIGDQQQPPEDSQQATAERPAVTRRPGHRVGNWGIRSGGTHAMRRERATGRWGFGFATMPVG